MPNPRDGRTAGGAASRFNLQWVTSAAMRLRRSARFSILGLLTWVLGGLCPMARVGAQTPVDRIDLAIDPVRGRVLETSGAPLEGARLTVPARGADVAAARPRTLATTDAEGRYAIPLAVLRGLPNEAQIEVHKAGFVSGVVFPASADCAAGTLGDLELDVGRKVPVFVKDTAGDAVVGARVHVRSVSATPWDPRPTRSWAAQTDERGLASIVDAPRGAVAVEVQADGYYTQRQPLATEPILVTLEPSGFLSGRIVAPTDARIDTARLSVRWKTATWHESRGAFAGGPVNADGTFRRTVERPTPWRIEVVCVVDGDQYAAATGWRSGSAEELELDLEVVPGCTVQVRSSGGEILPDAQIATAWLPNRRGLFEGRIDALVADRWVDVGADGQMRIARPVEPGPSAFVRVRAPGYGRVTVPVVEFGPAAEVVVTLAPEEDVSGVVLAADGKPVADALVTGEYVEVPSNEIARPALRAWTDADGRFTLREVGTEIDAVSIRRRGYRVLHRSYESNSGPVRTTEYRLTPAVQTLARVADLPDGATLSFSASLDPKRYLQRAQRVARNGERVELPFGAHEDLVSGRFRPGAGDGSGAVGHGQSMDVGLLVRDAEAGLVVRAAGDFPFPRRVHGRIACDVDPERLAVVMVTQDAFVSVGESVPVNADGTYSILSKRGRPRLAVVDRATGIGLHLSERLRVRLRADLEHDVELECGRVRVELTPADRGARTEDRRLWVLTELSARSAVRGGEARFTRWIEVDLATPTLDLLVPPGDLQLVALPRGLDPETLAGGGAGQPDESAVVDLVVAQDTDATVQVRVSR